MKIMMSMVRDMVPGEYDNLIREGFEMQEVIG